MRRREFIALAGGVAAWPIAARGQQGGRVRKIGVLIGVRDDIEGQARLSAFREALQSYGWQEGLNVELIIRFTGEDPEPRRILSGEIVKLSPDVILANTGPVLAEVSRVTKSIPIVFAQVPDAVSGGYVSNLAQPGANITGFTGFEYDIAGKWLGLLKEAVPTVSRVIVLGTSGPTSSFAQYLEAANAASKMLAVEMVTVDVKSGADIDNAMAPGGHLENCGLLALPFPIVTTQLEKIVGLAAQRRLPAVYPYKYFVERGGLMSYGFDNRDLFRLAASYVDRILRGEKPGDLPVQGPNRFELTLRLKSAKALGITFPVSLLSRADEVVE